MNATKFRDACPQLNYDLHGLNMSEDCLYLNIFTPNATSTYKYPVMIYIHGGSLLSGHAAEYPVSGIIRNLVSRGVVVVTLQYRLGLLGFFTTRTSEFPANLGSLDQVEAIKFVVDEIKNFGGNPYAITLFGQSAGSASVSAHLFSPVSQSSFIFIEIQIYHSCLDLFQQAIMESGSIFTCLDGAMGFKNMSQERAEQLCNFTSTDWNSKNYTALKACMMNTSYEEFIALDVTSFYGWNMVQDDYFLPDVPRNLFKNRPNIPVIYGNCHDEWSMADLERIADGTLPLDTFNKMHYDIIVLAYVAVLTQNYPERLSDIQSVLNSVYASPSPPDSDHVAWLRILNDAMTGAGLTAFTGREVDWYVYNNNSNVYTYEFDWPTNVGRPVVLPGWSRKSFIFLFMNFTASF